MPKVKKGSESFNVTTAAARKKLRAAEKAQAPLATKPTNFSGPATYPAMYGVDLKERQRQAILRDITRTGS